MKNINRVGAVSRQWNTLIVLSIVIAQVFATGFFSRNAASAAETMSAPVSKDAYIDQNHTNNNYGNSTSLKVSSEKTVTMSGY